MKRWHDLRPDHFAWLMLSCTALTDLCVWLCQLRGGWPFVVLGFVGVVLIPGAAFLHGLRIRFKSFLESLLYSLGLSVLSLMVGGLLINQLLHGLGMQRPLEVAGVLGMWNILSLAGIITSCFNPQKVRLQARMPAKFLPEVWASVLLSSLLPFVAAAGAFRLNNGGNALFAQIALWAAAGLFGFGFLRRKHLPDGTIAWLIFCAGLSVLLMTSLRSWDISGHDLAREYQVFSLTNLHGHWDISAFRSAYNACLSITILPQSFAVLLNISGLVVFKLLLQIIFAACPVVIYLILRRFVSKLGALAGCVLFIGYPTFVNDSAMLTRQGVAYFFFALTLLLIVSRVTNHYSAIHRPLSAKNGWVGQGTMYGRYIRRTYGTLFLLCSAGVMLSHYSTSYLFVALFFTALVCKWFIERRLSKRKHQLARPYFTMLTLPVILGLLLMSFAWYAQATKTSTGLIITLKNSLTNIPHMFSEDNKSTDTSAALVFSASKSQVDLYEAYLQDPTLNKKSDVHYLPSLTTDDLPLTNLGTWALGKGFDPLKIIDLRQGVAKILQLLALGGVGYTGWLLVRQKSFKMSLDYWCLCVAGLMMLGFIVLLPTFSVDYGILRAFQQALIFLIVPIILLLAKIGRRLYRRLRLGGCAVGMLGYFLIFSGEITQLLGGGSAALNLNNHGLYYGLYYTTAADLSAYAWMKANLPKSSDVRSASFARATMHDPGYPFTKTGILPSQIQPNSYVYLDQAQVVAHRFYVYYQSSPFMTTFPNNYFSDAKNRIYSTTTTEIYR